jgi:pyruvate, water dikinase
MFWHRSKHPETGAADAESRLREKYISFRRLLSLNSECLELMAGLQEDLQYVPPLRNVLGGRVATFFEKAQGIVDSLGRMTGTAYPVLQQALKEQQQEVENYIGTRQETSPQRLAVWLSEVGIEAGGEVGGKAAALGEIKNRLHLPVPNGYILTTEAYRQFCGVPLWTSIRDLLRQADLDDLERLQAISARLIELVMTSPVPRAVEVAISERTRILGQEALSLAARSSAVGEGTVRSFAGQFVSRINVRPDQVIDAYKRVVAGRFSDRALSYRLSTGLSELESPMAVLFLPVIDACASGVLYTRDPEDAKRDVLWVTSTWGLGLDIAGGRVTPDLFVLARRGPHVIVKSHVVSKEEKIVPAEGGGVRHQPLAPDESGAPSLEPEHLRKLAEYGCRMEDYFRAPQDIEWVLDRDGKIWILQARPLVVAGRSRSKGRAGGEMLVSGGVTVCPGQVSGPAYLAEDRQALLKTPESAIVIIRRASPEIVEVLPRIAGLIAERGNLAGHAATLLREFKVPSVLQMADAFGRITAGETISLDASQFTVYRGALWPAAPVQIALAERYRARSNDALSRRLLTLHLLDVGAFSFRPGGCKSAHDVLRFCHERAVEAMFALQDGDLENHPHRSKKLLASVPVNLFVLDLGGGLDKAVVEADEVAPPQITSRPFQALWKGITHPAVSWKRQMPASLGDLASIITGSLSSQNSVVRALGERSYLLVADEYMNLNSRLAYHFSLVDACLSDNPSNNYISFRFTGGGSTRQRRSLRACFLEDCLSRYGFIVDRRGDLVNAWFKRASAQETDTNLDILGRLMACSSQLDMYMSSLDAMKWYTEQFLAGNYSFRVPNSEPSKIPTPPPDAL